MAPVPTLKTPSKPRKKSAPPPSTPGAASGSAPPAPPSSTQRPIVIPSSSSSHTAAATNCACASCHAAATAAKQQPFATPGAGSGSGSPVIPFHTPTSSGDAPSLSSSSSSSLLTTGSAAPHYQQQQPGASPIGSTPASSPSLGPHLAHSKQSYHQQQQYHHRKNSSGSVKSIRSFIEPDAGPNRFPTAPTPGEIFDTFEREQEAIVNKLQKEIAQLKNDRSRSRSRSTSSSTSISRHPSTRSIYSLSDTEDHFAMGQGSSKTISSHTSHYPPTGLGGGSTSSLIVPSSSSSAAVAAPSSSSPGYPGPAQQPAGSGSASISHRTSRSSFGSVTEDSPILVNLRKENENLKKRLADLSIKITEKDKEIERLKSKH